MGWGAKQDRQAAPITVDMAAFASSLRTAWREGEQRLTHRRPYRRRKPVPKRGSMMDGVADEVRSWMAVTPGISAEAVLVRLAALYPDRFRPSQLRTVQRAVKAWRREQAWRTLALVGSPAEPPPGVPAAAGTPGEAQPFQTAHSR